MCERWMLLDVCVSAEGKYVVVCVSVEWRVLFDVCVGERGSCWICACVKERDGVI